MPRPYNSYDTIAANGRCMQAPGDITNATVDESNNTAVLLWIQMVVRSRDLLCVEIHTSF